MQTRQALATALAVFGLAGALIPTAASAQEAITIRLDPAFRAECRNLTRWTEAGVTSAEIWLSTQEFARDGEALLISAVLSGKNVQDDVLMGRVEGGRLTAVSQKDEDLTTWALTSRLQPEPDIGYASAMSDVGEWFIDGRTFAVGDAYFTPYAEELAGHAAFWPDYPTAVTVDDDVTFQGPDPEDPGLLIFEGEQRLDAVFDSGNWRSNAVLELRFAYDRETGLLRSMQERSVFTTYAAGGRPYIVKNDIAITCAILPNE